MGKEIQSTNIQQIETEITLLKNQTAQNIIEIGKRLNQAKELLPHGEWGKWLEEKVTFTRQTANKFMRIANEYSNVNAPLQLGTEKLWLMIDIPTEEREEFIQDNKVDEMTTRQLQQAIKEKKDAEKRAEELKIQLEREKNKPPKVVEKTPDDYNKYKRQVSEKQSQINELVKEKELLIKKAELCELYKKENEKYKKYKEAEENLSQPVRGFTRQMHSATGLSGLVVEVEHFLETTLSPVKYSRAIKEARNDKIVSGNLREIINRVQDWVDEMETYLPDGDMETVDYEIIE